MIVHVFRLKDLIYLVDSADCFMFKQNNPESEDIGIVPFTEDSSVVRVH